jgi:hypothetical protein
MTGGLAIGADRCSAASERQYPPNDGMTCFVIAVWAWQQVSVL